MSWAKVLAAVGAYHLAVGAVVVHTFVGFVPAERRPSVVGQLEWVVAWPVVLGANRWGSSYWFAIVDQVEETLKECAKR